MFYGGPKRSRHARHLPTEHTASPTSSSAASTPTPPTHDGTAIWGDFDAQEIFNNLAGDLKIKPLNVGFAAFYESLKRVDLMENHAEEKPVFISGKQVRATLLEGKEVDPRIMRHSTSKILVEAMAGK